MSTYVLRMSTLAEALVARRLGGIGPALFGKTRLSLLALLFTHSERLFYLPEIVRLTGRARGAPLPHDSEPSSDYWLGLEPYRVPAGRG